MNDKKRKALFIITLFLVLLYFTIQETGVGISALFSSGWIGAMLGRILGTLVGAIIAVYPYLILRRLFLKIGFPTKAELFGFILYTMIIITAIRQVPR